MSTEGRFLFLGTGSSGGVPAIGCTCAVCISSNPKNTRFRSSGLLTIGSSHLLVDVGTDVRMQCLAHHISSVDALFITHSHYDHIGGLEEMRAFTLHKGASLPCFISESDLRNIKKLFYYHFFEIDSVSNRAAKIDYRVLSGSSGHFSFEGVRLEYVQYFQGSMSVLGFRLGSFAYLTDLKTYPEDLIERLQGVQVLVTSALRFDPSKVQMNVDEAVDFIGKIGPQCAYITHMSHELEYEALSAHLPSHIRPAYDGLEISFLY